MGKPTMGQSMVLPPEFNRVGRAIRGEVKHLSNRRKIKRIDSVSSGERKRNSPNLRDLSWRGCRATMWKRKG